MKIVSWNVNSLKVRLPQVLDYLGQVKPEVLCLQETKTEDVNFPLQAIESSGYQVAFAGQKTYNGVAILSRHPLTDIVVNNPFYADEQKRLIAATIEGVRVICAYIPNGQAVGTDKYLYKMAWLDALHQWIEKELSEHDYLALAGDYNIAPEDRDVHDPKAWAGQILCSEQEREAFQGLLKLNMKDSFRLFEQEEKSFSWWDYRTRGFARNQGLRIDHILLSEKLAAKCTAAGIDKEPRKHERPSDHAPVWASVGDGW